MSTMRARSHDQGKAQRRRQASAFSQLVDLFLIELTNWRWSWRSMLITGTLAPVFSILAMGIFARDSGQQALTYVLTGNMVISLMFGNMGNVQSHFTFMRFQGALDYYATLPIRKYLLILAVVLSFLLLSAPSLIVTTLLGALVLQIPIRLHPVIVLVIPACAVPLSGIGALIGASVRNHHQADALSLIVTMGLAGFGPVVVPPDRLPPLLLTLGRLSPATYAASALRQAVIGPLTGQLALDLAALSGWAAFVFILVSRMLDWRQR
jgi:ABC-2 type transport system permease protein